MNENTYFDNKVKQGDYIAHGTKELYCKEVKKNVKIKMFLKRPKQINDIYTGWRPQNNKCTGYEICKNENCKHFKDFKINY